MTILQVCEISNSIKVYLTQISSICQEIYKIRIWEGDHLKGSKAPVQQKEKKKYDVVFLKDLG